MLNRPSNRNLYNRSSSDATAGEPLQVGLLSLLLYVVLVSSESIRVRDVNEAFNRRNYLAVDAG